MHKNVYMSMIQCPDLLWVIFFSYALSFFLREGSVEKKYDKKNYTEIWSNNTYKQKVSFTNVSFLLASTYFLMLTYLLFVKISSSFLRVALTSMYPLVSTSYILLSNNFVWLFRLPSIFYRLNQIYGSKFWKLALTYV